MGYPTPTGTFVQVTQVHTNRSAVAVPKCNAVAISSKCYVAQTDSIHGRQSLHDFQANFLKTRASAELF